MTWRFRSPKWRAEGTSVHASNRAGFSSYVVVWAVALVSVLLTTLVWYLAQHRALSAAQQRFELESKNISEAINQRMSKYQLALRSGVALFSASSSVERNEWHQFLAALDAEQGLEGMQAVGFAPFIKATQAASFERSVRKEGFAEFSLHPQKDAEFRAPVTYIEPFSGINMRAFGFDMWSETRRREAMILARDTGMLAMTPTLTLVQDSADQAQPGFLLYVPIYKNGHSLDSLPARKDALLGFVYGAYRTGDLFNNIELPFVEGLDFEVLDGDGPTPGPRVYASAGLANYGATPAKTAFHFEQIIPIGGYGWTLRFRATPAYAKAVSGNETQAILIGGLLIDGLLVALFSMVISQRRQALELARNATLDLSASQQNFQAVADTAHDGILTLSTMGQISYANAAAQRLFGLSSAQLAKAIVDDVFVDAQAVREMMAQEGLHSAEDGQQHDSLHVWARRHGEADFAAELSISAWHTDDLYYYTVLVRDITERKEFESAMIAAREAAEDGLRAKSDFLATMSHEIRTPMNGVLGMAELLALSELDAMQRKQLKIIQDSGSALLVLINDILDFSRIEAGRMTIEMASFNLEEVAIEVCRLVGSSSNKSDIELVVSCAPRCAGAYIGDAVRLRQIMTNLIGNAYKFTERGSVELSIEYVESGLEETHLRIAVRDTGIGISAKAISQLFTAFTQADASTTRRYGGTGLGLAICKRLVDAMGGTIGVNSQVGEGSEFWLELVLARDLQEVSPAPRPVWPRPLKVGLLYTAGQGQKAIVDLFERLNVSVKIYADVAAIGALGEVPVDVIFAQKQCLQAEPPACQQLAAGTPALAPIVLLCVPSERIQAEFMHGLRIAAQFVVPSTASMLADVINQVLGFVNTAQSRSQVASLPQFDACIMLAEDNPTNREVAMGILKRLGLRVVVAEDGLQVLEKWDPAQIQLILMDAHMPNMDGLEATRQLRLLATGKEVPIVALTASVMADDKARCLAAGMSDFMTKPFRQIDMIETLRRWLPDACVFPEAPALAPASVAVVSDSAVPVLEVSTLRGVEEETGLDAEQWLLRFTADTEKTLQQLHAAAEAGELAELRRFAHSMKSSAALLGALRLSEAMRALEAAANDSSAIHLPALIAKADQEFAQFQRTASDLRARGIPA